MNTTGLLLLAAVIGIVMFVQFLFLCDRVKQIAANVRRLAEFLEWKHQQEQEQQRSQRQAPATGQSAQ